MGIPIQVRQHLYTGIAPGVWILNSIGTWTKTGLKPSFPPVPYIRQGTGSVLLQVITCRLIGAKPLPEPMLTYCQLDPSEQTAMNFESKSKTFQAISWADVDPDLWHHLVSLGHNELPGRIMWFADFAPFISKSFYIYFHGIWCIDKSCE